MDERQWRFRSRDTGFDRVTRLWLYREIDGSSCDDADDQAGPGNWLTSSLGQPRQRRRRGGHSLSGDEPSDKWYCQ
jgi:hypothetical protein